MSSWDVLHPLFKFCAPANYPTNYDQQPVAPLPPNGRELNLPIQGTQQMLHAIRLMSNGCRVPSFSDITM